MWFVSANAKKLFFFSAELMGTRMWIIHSLNYVEFLCQFITLRLVAGLGSRKISDGVVKIKYLSPLSSLQPLITEFFQFFCFLFYVGRLMYFKHSHTHKRWENCSPFAKPNNHDNNMTVIQQPISSIVNRIKLERASLRHNSLWLAGRSRK